MSDWDSTSCSTDFSYQNSLAEDNDQLELFKKAALKEAIEEARRVFQENDPVHMAAMRAGYDSGEYRIAKWVCGRIASERDKMRTKLHQERTKVRDAYERKMTQIEQDAKLEAASLIEREQSADYQGPSASCRVHDAQKALASEKESADRRILAAERVLAAEKEAEKARLLLSRYNDQQSRKVRRSEDSFSSSRAREENSPIRSLKRSYSSESQDEEDQRDAWQMRKIRKFERIKSDLYAAYKIDRTMRTTLALDRAMSNDPYPARRLLGERPRDEFHRLRVQRNAFAHSEQ